jgi:hypothetical protein
MRPPRMPILLLALALMACSDPFPCTRYCWSHQQDVLDMTDAAMMGVPDGRFDGHCTTSSGVNEWYPPLPPFGFYAAEQCVSADIHSIIARTVATIQDPTLDADQACDVTDLQVYADFVATLAHQARDACVDHLTCKHAPAGCDIDPGIMGNQACTIATAEFLCDQVVLAPALAALTDLTNAPGAAQPQRDGTVTVYVQDPAECEPLLQADTDDPPACDDPDPGADGLDDSTGGTGTTGEGTAPFGDIDSLVTCPTPTRCLVEAELFAHVQRSVHVFHDEGVELAPVAIPGIPRGFQLTGLDDGDASEQLLRALGLADGDVVTHVDGTSIASMEAIERLLLAVPTTTSWTLTVQRRKGSTWTPLPRTITRAP